MCWFLQRVRQSPFERFLLFGWLCPLFVAASAAILTSPPSAVGCCDDVALASVAALEAKGFACMALSFLLERRNLPS